jgi:hypothetical protein
MYSHVKNETTLPLRGNNIFEKRNKKGSVGTNLLA